MKAKMLGNLIYWILIINIPSSVILSALLGATEGNHGTVQFIWNLNSHYFFAIFLGFLLVYPFLFLTLYLISFVLISLYGLFIKK